MQVHAEEIFNFIIAEENKMLTILKHLESKGFTNRQLSNLQRLSNKNIKLFEKHITDLQETSKHLEMNSIILSDFSIDIKGVKNFDYQTALIFLIKFIVKFIELIEILCYDCKDDVFLKTFNTLCDEKQKIKQQIENMYDKSVLNQK